jgi:hypothetical protein
MNSHLLSFEAAFDYAPWAWASRGVFVPITLGEGANSSQIIDVRVDSASTYSVFGRQWADLLDLDWDAGDVLTISTASGTFRARLHEVTVSLLDWQWSVWAAFAEWDTAPPSPRRDVLGLTGFFDHFVVAIDDLAQIIFLEPKF